MSRDAIGVEATEVLVLRALQRLLPRTVHGVWDDEPAIGPVAAMGLCFCEAVGGGDIVRFGVGEEVAEVVAD